jgi:hypothetical protein
MAGRKARAVGFFSRRNALARCDGRTHEGRLARAIESELLDHLGGPEVVTPPQRLLVRATALVALRLALASERFSDPKADVESLDRHFCSLVNSLRLNLLALGLTRPEQAPKRLADLFTVTKAVA